jgi:hypothetical protein
VSHALAARRVDDQKSSRKLLAFGGFRLYYCFQTLLPCLVLRCTGTCLVTIGFPERRLQSTIDFSGYVGSSTVTVANHTDHSPAQHEYPADAKTGTRPAHHHDHAARYEIAPHPRRRKLPAMKPACLVATRCYIRLRRVVSDVALVRVRHGYDRSTLALRPNVLHEIPQPN